MHLLKRRVATSGYNSKLCSNAMHLKKRCVATSGYNSRLCSNALHLLKRASAVLTFPFNQSQYIAPTDPCRCGLRIVAATRPCRVRASARPSLLKNPSCMGMQQKSRNLAEVCDPSRLQKSASTLLRCPVVQQGQDWCRSSSSTLLTLPPLRSGATVQAVRRIRGASLE